MKLEQLHGRRYSQKGRNDWRTFKIAGETSLIGLTSYKIFFKKQFR